jgi:FkbM family methyltransferase
MYEERIKLLALLVQNKLAEPARNILDVGAHSGDWTRTMSTLFQDAKFLMIEANPKKTKALSAYSTQSGHQFEIAVVGDKAKSVVFHAHKHFNTGGSVFREENYKYWKPHVIETFSAEMVTIDSIVKRRGFGPVDMLKIDIQGAEFIALLGAVETLASVTYVMLEASVHQYNPGAAGFADINTFLELQGFRLYDIIDFRQDKLVWDKMPDHEQWGPENKFPVGKILMQFDCLWARNTSLVFSNQGYANPPPSRFAHSLLPDRG